MKVSEILALVPDRLLDELALETDVNRYSKKLQGQLMFKLLLYCLLSYKDNSLRMMECAYESVAFKLLTTRLPKGSVHHSSLGERLNAMDATYFEKLYQSCLVIYREKISAAEPLPETIVRFDSTIVSLSAALLKVGYQLPGGDAKHMRQLKFTIGLETLPQSARLFSGQKHTSENAALREAVISACGEENELHSIKIFDRGITSRNTYDELTERKARFISRLGKQNKKEECKPNELTQPLDTATLTILSDNWVYLFAMGGKRTKHPVRLIRAVSKKDGGELLFVTNIADLPADVITELYKRRWDIEVFFKFLKQELNFSHLLSRTENGIKVMLYATMIASVLLLVYKKTNQIKGYKIMKHKFLNELERALVKDFVIMCKGKPELLDILLKPPL